MFKPVRKKNKIYGWLLLALAFGWFIHQVVKPETIYFGPFPPLKPKIVSRTEWGARTISLYAPEEYGVFDPQTNPEGVLYYVPDLRGVLNTIVIHHSAFSNAGPADIQNLHMDRRGFADIAYQFVIDEGGVIYEGRDLHIRGAHVQGFNTGAVGIVLIGNFNLGNPTQLQIDSLEILVDYLRYTYSIRYLAGHKDYPGQSPDGTECPGDQLYRMLPYLAEKLGMKYGTGGYVRPEWVE